MKERSGLRGIFGGIRQRLADWGRRARTLLGRPAPRPAPGLSASDSVAEAMQKIFISQLIVMLEQEPIARLGRDPEGVHQMRVAIRRLRAALRMFRHYLPAEDYRQFNRGLRAAGWSLGPARDLDVFLLWVAAVPAAMPALKAAALAMRERARRDLLSFLNHGRYRKGVARLHRFLRRPPDPASPPLAPLVSGLLRYQLGRALAFDPLLPVANASQVHRLRVELKRLRYAIEVFQEILGPQTDGLIETMKSLQDDLGALNDAISSLRLLERLVAEGDGRVLEEAAALIVMQRQAREEHWAALPGIWQEFRSETFERLLDEAIVKIESRPED